MPGIYVHIPFCHKRCTYCNFYLVTNLKLVRGFLDNLEKEITLTSGKYCSSSFDTIYFGGGTPSVLSPGDISSVIQIISDNFNIEDSPEITLEANPEDLLDKDLNEHRKAGINRVSLGVQSFRNNELKFLTREHTAAQAVEIVEEVKEHFNNFTIDIIYSLPGQTIRHITESLDMAISLDVPHISAYALTFEPGTVLDKQREKDIVRRNSGNTEAEHYEFVVNKLVKNGYKHYEISSFSKPGHHALHNGKYWNFEEYIGLGPSAHSFFNNSRWSNHRSMSKYAASVNEDKLPIESIHLLSEKERKFEYIMTSLRSSGIDLEKYENLFNETFASQKNEVIELLKREQLAVNTGTHFRLTEKGYSIADEIISKYF